VAGITGGELRKRIQLIVASSPKQLGHASRLALCAVAIGAIAGPVALGLAHQPLVFGQILKATGPRPSFEVASIHVWKRPAPPPAMVGGEQVISQQVMKFSPGREGAQTGDRVHMIAPLGVLIAQAYGLPPGSEGRADGRIVGGPDWMNQDDEQYDIQAKIDDQKYTAMQKMTAEQQREQVNLMKQSLLADRFKLKVHFETRQLPAYALVVAKGGPKLMQAKDDESPMLSSTRRGQTTEMSVTAATLARFVDSPLLSAGTSGRTVVDQTGLKGKYDFTLKWAAEAAAGQEPSDEPALFTAIQEQLGLKLVPTKGPVEVIVIDHIEKPTADGAEIPNAIMTPPH
jgi:bla regulator protein BlaR1